MNENEKAVQENGTEQVTEQTSEPAETKKKTASKAKTTPTMNIFQRMLAVEKALEVVGKNLDVGFGKNKYKAVSERDIIDAVKPLEAEYGIYSYPYSREIVESRTTDTTKSDGGTLTTYMTRIKTIYRFVNVDKPDEYIETTVFSEGIDTLDKGSGKAMTYGDKYALMKAYKISTGDDPDAVASPDSEDSNDTPKPAKTWGTAKTPASTPAQQETPKGWGKPPAQQNSSNQTSGKSGWGGKPSGGSGWGKKAQ